MQARAKAAQVQPAEQPAVTPAHSAEQRARQTQNVVQPAEQQAPAPARRTRLVIALGGNMLQPHQGATASEQKHQVARVASLLVDLAADYEIVLNHGAGPQIGNLDWHENMGASNKAPAMPLETVIAMTQGQIGYWLMQALTNEMLARGQEPHVAALLGQVVVDPQDAAFQHPNKEIGPFYSRAQAQEVEAAHGFTFKEVRPGEWRRVVASPLPQDIVEKKVIRDTVATGALVIATSSGGIPVYRTETGALQGIDAVVDKDFTAEKMAELIEADILVSLTGVPQAYLNYGQPTQQALDDIGVKAARQALEMRQFGVGSMAPKVAAAIKFAESSKKRTSIITDPAHLQAALRGEAGTIIKEEA